MRKSIISLAMAVLITISSFTSVFADTTAEEYGNTALTIINKINTYQPQESELLSQTGKPPLEVYGRLARYMFYLSQLEDLYSQSSALLPAWVEATLNEHKNYRTYILPKFELGFATSTYQTVLEKIITESSTRLDSILKDVNESDNKTGLYRENFNAIKANIKLWSDSVRFYRDEGGLGDDKFNEYSDKFNKTYDAVMQLNEIVGLNMNLGFVRPEASYNETSSIEHNFIDENRNLKVGFLDVFTLSAFIDNSSLEDYSNKLQSESKELYDAYSKFRVPLYSGNEKEPIKALYKDGEKVIIKSNLRNFIEYPDNEQVLYIPLYNKDVTVGTDTVTEEQTTTDLTKKESELEFYPVYMKGNSGTFVTDIQKVFTDKVGNKYELPDYETARMNYMQFINFYESGKMNDYQSDLSYPLFMDAWGNIETYSGKVIIPAVSNMNFYTDNTYFPLNAFFINNYPIQSAETSISNLIPWNTDSYVITTGNSEKDIVDGKEVGFRISQYNKNGTFKKINVVGMINNIVNGTKLPTIKPYLEEELSNGEFKRTLFMKITGKDDSYVLGLKESMLLIEDKYVPFTFINDNVPVHQWNMHYLYGKDGDRRRLDNELLMKIANSCYNNPDTEYAKMKTGDSQKVTYGFKMGAAIEPLHKRMSEAAKNYNLYTPSIAELPGVNRYISTLLIPALEIALLVALVFILIKYVRNIKSMSLVALAFSIAVVIAVNYAVTAFYPAVLNTGFNGMVSKVLGKNGYYMTLYNIEKDLNSKGEFVYGDEIYDEKIVSPGSYIKVAELRPEEVKRYRAAEENSPFKDSDYYIPEWDTSTVTLGKQMFIKGTSLYMYVKDLTSSTAMLYKNGEYMNVWEKSPEYTFYIPYLSILDGVTKSVNNYSAGVLTPKTLVYSSGYETYTGASLAYFSSRYFLIDNESAKNSSEEFKEKWQIFNNGDFLNLKNVLYLEPDEGYFPVEKESRVKESRWFRVATEGRTEDEINRKILDVNLATKNFIIEMLPYMNNVGDEIMLKMIALYATVEFNKEFSRPILDVIPQVGDALQAKITGEYDWDFETEIYPQRLELDSINVDEHLKISLVNISDLLRFNVTSIYKFVENQGSWFGILLLGVVSFLLYVRSIMRIALITIIIVIVLMYAVIVYALQRDYTNKTVIGLVGIIGMSWGVYFIDNILTIGFISFDKSSAGVLLMILLVWLLWNLVATGIYLLIFEMIRRDVSAFGGNIMYSMASTALSKTNDMVRSALGLVSKTRAENFDITRPDFDIKAEEYENYLSMDFNEKLLNRQETIETTANQVKTNLSDKFADNFPKAYTLKEAYAQSQSAGLDTMVIMGSMGVNDKIVTYLQSKGIEVTEDEKTRRKMFSGDMDKWKTIVDENTLQTEPFEYYKEKDGNLYFRDTGVNEEFMNKAGISYSKLNKHTFSVDSSNANAVEHMMSALRTPLYKINEDKEDVLRKVEGVLPPNEYSIGSNAIYLSDKDKAEELFGADKVTPTYKTQVKIPDYSDRVDNGYIADNLEFSNGLIVSNEYIHGKLSREMFKDFLEEDIKIQIRGKEEFLFNREDRDKVVDIIKRSASYLDKEESIEFTDKSDLDTALFGLPKTEKEVEEESEEPKDTESPENVEKEDVKEEVVDGLYEDLTEMDLGLDDTDLNNQ